VLALLLAPGAAREAGASEYYFALIFGSQSQPKRWRYTHTWETIVRAVGEGPDLNTYQLYVHTISWLPASGKIRPLAIQPEPGANLTLEATLATVLGTGQRVRVWGPFVITPEVYNRSLAVYNTLNSGAVLYRAYSREGEPHISDCIHAVAAVDDAYGRDHYKLIRVGIPASRFIAREITVRSPAHGIDQRLYDGSWLLPRLGLDRYPIESVRTAEIPMARCVLCRCPE
jgi:hypothetical protein